MTEEETEELLNALGIGWDNPVDALVFDWTVETSVAGLHVVVVRPNDIILVTHGLDSDGPYVLVRKFTERDEPTEAATAVEQFGNAVEVR